ncbi:MAG: 2'-5' RNA ligase family protein [Candidatus Saccharibacteria bacterium]
MVGEHCYFFTLEVTPMKVGDRYSAMPLHCTLMPKFFSNLSADALSDQVNVVFHRTTPLRLRPTERAAFGPQRVMATLIKPTPAVLKLHAALYLFLNQLGVRYTESDWVGPGYRPHVSDQSNSALPLNRTLPTRAVYLIEVEHPLNGKRRFIRSKISLTPRSK